jgi:hypothetical protein
MKTTVPLKKTNVEDKSKLEAFAFTRDNYKWVLIGLVFLLVGFLLLIGGGSDDPNVYSDKVFNFQRWTLSPLLILTGYAIEIYAIMKKSVD